MKKNLLLIVFAFSLVQIFAQSTAKSDIPEDRNFRIPLIGEKAPEFTAETTNGELNFPSDFGKKWKILFSHPQDFTPVCSSELLELAYMQDEFEKLGVKVAVISTDPVGMHKQWKKSLESLDIDHKGTVKINFPLIGDDNVTVAKLYGMIHPENNSTRSVRGVFIIDPDNVIDAISFYPMNVGRNIGEILRTITALQTSARLSSVDSKVLTPANWTEGKDLLITLPPKADQSSSTSSVPDGYYSPVWYMWFKKGQ